MQYDTNILSEIQTWCHYADIIEEIQYGALYNWYAATDARNICSAGWHAGTQAEYDTLMLYLGDWIVAGGKMKEIGTTYWNDPNVATNEAEFNARGAGWRREDGSFAGITLLSALWTEVDDDINWGYIGYLTSASTNFDPYSSELKKVGCSVRPIKDATTLTHGQTGTYTGNDGKVYRTICIGTQEWLADNLAETKYRDGSDIPVVTDNAVWAALVTGAMCYYNNDISNA